MLPSEYPEANPRRTRRPRHPGIVDAMRPSRPVTVLLAVVAAVVLNLAVFAIGGALGASYDFPTGGTTVAWYFVVGMTAIPLAIALTAVALLAPRWPWISTAALIAAPVLAVVSIPLMPVPVGFDLPTTIALSAMHLVVGAVGAIGVVALRGAQAASRSTIGSSASA